MIDAELLDRLGWVDPEGWAAVLGPSAITHHITLPRRVAMAVANFGHESNGGRNLVENLNYSNTALLGQWPSHFSREQALRFGRCDGHPADQEAIANCAYGGRMGNVDAGDGWLWRGRGLLMVTGRANYARLALINRLALRAMPAWLETQRGAAESACAYWEFTGCNELADAGLVTKCRERVNGGRIGLIDVQARYALAMLTVMSR